MFQIVAQVQTATQYKQQAIQVQLVLPSETITNTVKHGKICPFCQKPGYLYIINNSEIA